jgi:hypothetical protein
MNEQSCVSENCFHKAAYKNLNHYLSLRFNALNIVMSPWQRHMRHRIINDCISMDTCALVRIHTHTHIYIYIYIYQCYKMSASQPTRKQTCVVIQIKIVSIASFHSSS